MSELTAGIRESGLENPETALENPETAEARFVDRLNPWLVNVLTALGFGLPIVGYFWIIYHYSVNVIVRDQLSDMPLIKASYGHLFPWGALWSQYNEDRSLFPNLVVVLLAHTVHFNVQIEEYLGALMLLSAVVLLLWAHKRRSPSTPWLYYCPVVVLAFSLVQYDTTLLGGVSWYLVLLSLAVAIVLLDRITLTWLVLIGAIAAAVVGSFSSFDGLLIWPTGLVLLYCRRRRAPFALAWVSAGIVSVVLYFHNFNTNAGAPDHGYAIQHPLTSLKFFLFAVGDVVGIPVKLGVGNSTVLMFGLVIVTLGIVMVALYVIRRDEKSGGPVGVALICFGLLFTASVTEARAAFGYWGASASRYTTYDLMILAGVYLALLGSPPLLTEEPSGQGTQSADKSKREASRHLLGAGIEKSTFQKPLRLARWFVVALIGIQFLFGVQNGLEGVRSTHTMQIGAVQVSRTVDRSSDNLVRYYLAPWYSALYIRRQIHTAEELHLSLFADGGHQR